MAGYDGRDPRATPQSTDQFTGRAFVAWNPSAPGAKIEDTVTIAHGTVTTLTVDERWPTVHVRGLDRPTVLEL
ncbi:hypothetical protein [Microbacterium panaciterrae]|uniref:Uncharacterized protein n=1 Tax=Microbacterium panaciterrae TaxID=985759 RepID=A0ABP8PL21_9MICO